MPDKSNNNIISTRILNAVIIAFTFCVGFFFGWNFIDIFVFIFFISGVLYYKKVNLAFILFGEIIIFSTMVFSFLFSQMVISERLAVYFYLLTLFFIIIAILRKKYSLKKDLLQISKISLPKKIEVFVLISGIFIGIYFDWELINLFFFEVFLWVFLKKIATEKIAKIALFFLITLPFLLLFKKDELAEEFAVYAYYFLVLAVIMGIYETRKMK